LRRLSVLDLGSNSFHVLVADLLDNGVVVPVGREREMLHLGAAVALHGRIPDDDRDRAVTVVAHLTELAGRLGAEDRLAVATSAFRDAANGQQVVDAMSDATGTPIRIIDGEEEARLAYRGVRASVAVSDEPQLVLDLGGGSLELVIGRGPDVLWSTSVDVGVSRMSTSLPDDPPRRKHVDALRQTIWDAIRPHRDAIRTHAPAGVVAVGGTIRALARIIAADEGTWLPATINQLPIATSEVAAMRDRLVRMAPEDREEVPGMKDKRADRIHVAAIILAGALEALRIEEFLLSDWGLREGVLLEAVGAIAPPNAQVLRQREVDRMRVQFTPDDPHLAHVADLAVQLFDGTRDLHGMNGADRDLLWYGAGLHDIGESLALRGHHKHGAYLLEHAEMRGFGPTETAMLCSIVRFHKSRGLSTDFLPYRSLRKREQRRVEKLVALLQVADGLDRARDQAVRTLEVRHDDTTVDVLLRGNGLHVAEAEVERKTALFERVLGVDLRVRAAEDA
jgi:exopolyphosphatase / guanosine-5'-triphosphate,3'-diphosphate pyrophosphatase